MKKLIAGEYPNYRIKTVNIPGKKAYKESDFTLFELDMIEYSTRLYMETQELIREKLLNKYLEEHQETEIE